MFAIGKGVSMDWTYIHDGFPGFGYRSGDYTIRPSSAWRGLFTLRRDDTVLIPHAPLSVIQAAHDLTTKRTKAMDAKRIDAVGARKALADEGYRVIGYPDDLHATNLIVQLDGQTRTTLKVVDGQVEAEAVDYLISEQRYAKDGQRQWP